MIAAVIFDLDGVLIDSEPVWEEVRRTFVTERGGAWEADTQRRLMGMSTRQWATYLTELGAGDDPDDVASAVIDRMRGRYVHHLPIIPGAIEAVRRMAERWPVGVASSSPPQLIATAIELAGLSELFRAITSSDEVGDGKPAPDVYLLATSRLGVAAAEAAAVEDSSNGVRSAAGAGCQVVAIPRPEYPLDPDAQARAATVLGSVEALTPKVVEALG